MRYCTGCWLCRKYNICTIGGFNIGGAKNCKMSITDKDIEAAQKEAETRLNKKMIDSFIDEIRFDFPEVAQLKTKAATKKEAESIDCFHVRVQKTGNTWVISGKSMDGSQFERPATAREVRSLSKLGLINATAQPSTKAAKEDADTDKLTCANCSFASKSDTRVFPAGISTSIPLPGGVLYCPERDTRVPGTLEGCELHSERKKDTESNLDEVNSLDNTIDECFREMKRLIAGTSENTRPTEQLRKEAVITKRIRAERDALKLCNEKLSKDNKVLRDKVSFLKANSKVIARYVELQDKDLEQRYEELNKLKEEVNSLEKELKTANLARIKEDNDKLRDENEILQQEVALLKSKRKKDSGYIASLEIKISRMKKELSGKWRLLEPGEEPQKGDQAFLIDSNNVRVWVEPNGFKGIVKEETVPVRRKITI